MSCDQLHLQSSGLLSPCTSADTLTSLSSTCSTATEFGLDGFLHDIIFQRALGAEECLGAIRKRLCMAKAPGPLLTFIVKHVIHVFEMRPYSAQLMATWLVILGDLLKSQVPGILGANLKDLSQYIDAIQDILSTCDLTKPCSRQQIQYLWYRHAVETSQSFKIVSQGTRAALSEVVTDTQRTVKSQAARLDLIRVDFLRLRALLHIKGLSNADDDVLTLVRSVLMGCSKMLQDVSVVHACIKDLAATSKTASSAQTDADTAMSAMQENADLFCQLSMHSE